MRLIDCFTDVIAYTAYFLKSPQKPGFNQVKADIQRLINESRNHFEKGSFAEEDYDLAGFAVCAWVDESIMGADWEEKNAWLKEPLQRLYYQTSNAGELFFERLNSLGPHQQNVREVYYICLALGFAGQYCNKGDDLLLDQLKLSNLKLLTGSSMGLPSLDRMALFPDAYPGESEPVLPNTAPGKLSPATIAGIGAPFVLFLVLYVIFRFVLSNVGNDIINMVP